MEIETWHNITINFLHGKLINSFNCTTRRAVFWSCSFDSIHHFEHDSMIVFAIFWSWIWYTQKKNTFIQLFSLSQSLETDVHVVRISIFFVRLHLLTSDQRNFKSFVWSLSQYKLKVFFFAIDYDDDEDGDVVGGCGCWIRWYQKWSLLSIALQLFGGSSQISLRKLSENEQV